MKMIRFLLGLFLLTAITARAQFTFVTNEGIAIINGYTGPSGPVVIPSELGGLPVTVVEGSSFEDKGITSVTIPDTVTNIGVQQFAPNDSLTSFTVASNNPVFSSSGGVLFSKSGTLLFEYPAGLSGVYSIPTNVTAIGQNAFAACYFLNNVIIPDSVTNIASEGFGFCFSLTNILIPASVTGVGPATFINCEDLSAITVAAGNPAYTSIGGVLFDKNETTLQAFPTALGGAYEIPEGVTTIGTNAFVLCDGLTDVTIPPSVTTISDGAFADCAGLTNVTLGAGVNDLVWTAFGGCDELQAINVNPSNAVYSSLNGVVFDKNQTTLIRFPTGFSGGYTVPNTVTSIAEYAFEGCALTDVIIPGNVSTIGFEALQGCGSLTNVTMSNGVVSIGEFAFGDSPKLATVTIPATVTYLPFGAFGYDGLTNATFLGNAPTADPQAFLGETSATIYYMPGTSGWGATFDGVPTALEGAPSPNGALQVTLFPTGVGAAGARWQVDGGLLQPSGAIVVGLSVGSHVVSFAPLSGWMTPSNQTVSVSANATNSASGTYIEEATAAAEFTFVTNNGTITITGYIGTNGAIDIPSVINGLAVTAIGQSAFGNSSVLTSVVIPDSVTNLGDFAFSACYALESVTISKGISEIGVAMFQDCISLSNVVIRGTVVNLEDDCFASCPLLSDISIPDTVTNIGQYVFFGDAITNAAIPVGVVNIGAAAFLNCSSLTAINVDLANPDYASASGVLFNKDQTTLLQYPEGKSGASYVISNAVIFIGDSAFEYSALTNVTIPESVTGIGNYSFEFCNGLGVITFPTGLTSIGNNAFGFCGDLGSVSLPASLTSLGAACFVDCADMTAIDVAAANPVYASADGILYNKAGTELVEFPGGVGGSFAVPSGVRDIGSQAFENSLISSVTLPASVTNLEDYAFSGCGMLGSVVMDNNVKNIGVAAFQNAYFLTNLVLSSSLANIGFSAFSDCSDLVTVFVPRFVTNIADYAFSYNPGLKAVYFEGNALPDDGTILFNDSGATVYYLPGATGWTSTFGTAATALAPEITRLTVAGSDLVFGGIDGQAGQTYVVLASADAALPCTEWTPVATNQAVAGGNFSITLANGATPATLKQFYVLQPQ